MKEFNEELEITEDSRMYADKRLDCKAICLLAKGIIVYCKKLGVPPKGTAKARLKSASLMRQQSKLEVQLDNSHW